MTNKSTLNILHGWDDFRVAHRVPNINTVQVFGAVMTSCEKSTKPAKREIAEAIEYVAQDLRKACQQFQIPLWPAVLPQKGVC